MLLKMTCDGMKPQVNQCPFSREEREKKRTEGTGGKEEVETQRKLQQQKLLGR